MSLNTTIKSWDEMVSFLQGVDHPQCFTVNFLPESGEYEMWIGNQPYYNYERLIELEEKDFNKLRKEFNTYKVEKEKEINNLHKALRIALETLENNDLMNHDYRLIHSMINEMERD
ncbi:hypothetical protein [Bacillus sp. FSL H8-0515]|uniref:hypothetical protein n=1 Tax=Bacillus sp. FSL H8-0515 TaxID=2921396 RepID=UPI0030F731C2